MYNPLGLPLMYNPLGPWNTWFALSSHAARVWMGTLRRITQGWAKPDAETDRIVTENVGATHHKILGAASKSTKQRVAKKAQAVAAKRNRRNRGRVRSTGVGSDRVAHRVKKVQKRPAA